jgi:hypothetical protein
MTLGNILTGACNIYKLNTSWWGTYRKQQATSEKFLQNSIYLTKFNPYEQLVLMLRELTVFQWMQQNVS